MEGGLPDSMAPHRVGGDGGREGGLFGTAARWWRGEEGGRRAAHFVALGCWRGPHCCRCVGSELLGAGSCSISSTG